MKWGAYIDHRLLGEVEGDNETAARLEARSQFGIEYGTRGFSVKSHEPAAEKPSEAQRWLWVMGDHGRYSFQRANHQTPPGNKYAHDRVRFVRSVYIPDDFMAAGLDALAEWYGVNFGVPT